MKCRWVVLVLAWLGAICCVGLAEAHEVRPAYLEITEPAPGQYQVLWKQPVMGDIGLPLWPRLSNGWLNGPPAETSVTAERLIKIWRVRTRDPAPLDRATVSVDGVDKSITDILVRVEIDGRRPLEAVLNAERSKLVLDFRSTAGMPAPAYLRLGVEHILGGIDHLSFVLGLLLLVGLNRRLLGAVTAFTAAHSLTLAAAALGLVRVPAAAIEALVALSILFIALEIIRAQRGRTGLTERRPWLIAFVFGLLHGFAFAGALAEIGLPPKAVLKALFLFNVGVEVGQLTFVGCAAAAMLAAQRLAAKTRLLPSSALAFGRGLPAYAIGAFAAFWFFGRMAVAFQLTA